MSKYTTRVIRAAGMASLTAVFAVAYTGAFAVSNGTSVVNSGDNAQVSTSNNYENSVKVNNHNDATVMQNVTANSNTGHNDANGNISMNGGGGTSMTTGNAVVNTVMGVTANENTTVVSMPAGQGGMNLTDVVNTGDKAKVNTDVSSTNKVTVQNSNSAYVSQGCGGGKTPSVGVLSVLGSKYGSHHGGCSANTGHNDANNNIGGTSMLTGTALVDTTMGANVNHNQTVVGSDAVGQGQMVNDTSVTNTGDKANVNTMVNSATRTRVLNYNSGMFNQFVKGNSNTGHNDANDNIGGAGMETGNGVVDVNMGVTANTNVTGIGSSAMGPASVNVFDVVNTGDNFDGDADTSSTLKTHVHNGSSLSSYQSMWALSNTGYSYTNDNVGMTSMLTGVGATGSSMYNSGNTNMTVLGSLGTLLSLLAL